MYVVHTLVLWNINYAIRCLLRVTALVHLHQTFLLDDVYRRPMREPHVCACAANESSL